MARQDGEKIASTCWECSTCCGSILTVRDGRVVNVAPNPDHPGSKGAFCVKGIRGALDWTYGNSRLTHPLRRVGPRGSGEWARCSWDEALGGIADGIASVREGFGPRAVVGATSGAYFSRGPVMALLMRSLGSPNYMINQDLCGGCRALSDRITGLGIANGEDIDRARCVLIVGRNSSAADPVQWMALKRAKARGARIVVIDPFRTPAADLADLWLRPAPNTDAAIALAMLRMMIADGTYDRAFVAEWCHGFEALTERVDAYRPEVAAALTGVPADAIVAAARLYADGPATFVSGHGIDAFSAGVQTFRAFHALVAISGNLDREGGNLKMKPPAGFRLYSDLLHDPAFRLPIETERQTIGADRFPLWAGPDGWQTACHNASVIDAILTGEPHPVRALFASGVNIAVTYPDTARTLAALRSLDVFAVAAHTMNPTAALADFVLPKTTALEEEEVSFHASGACLTYTAPAAARVGEVRPDIEIAAGVDGQAARAGRPHGRADALARPGPAERLPARGMRDLPRNPAPRRLRRRAAGAWPVRPGKLPDADRQGRAVLGNVEAPRPGPFAGLRTGRPGRRPGRPYGFPARAADGLPREDLPPFPLPRAGLGPQGLAGPARLRPSRHRRPRGDRRGRVDRGRDRRRLRPLPAQGQPHGGDLLRAC